MTNKVSLRKTNVGYHVGKFPVVDHDWKTVDTVEVRGIFALIPPEMVVFGRVMKAVNSRQVDIKNYRVALEHFMSIAGAHGFKFMGWKDDGLKDPSGYWRMLPFFRQDFSMMKFLAEQFNGDFSAKFQNINKRSKVFKYLTQPCDFDQEFIVNVYTIAMEDWNSDGCGVAITHRPFMPGLTYKVIGAGDGCFYKGMVATVPASHLIKPASMMKLAHILQDNSIDVIATTETVKGSEPGKVYKMKLYWHDDDTRNIKDEVVFPEQIVRTHFDNLNGTCMTFISKHMNTAVDEVNKITDWQGYIHETLNVITAADVDAGDPTENEIVKAYSELVATTGLPLVFRGVGDKIMRHLQTYVRNKIWRITMPGTRAFIVPNDNLGIDEIVVPHRMKNLGSAIGKEVTIFRLPNGELGFRACIIKGFSVNHIEINPENAKFFEADFDGDQMGIIPDRQIHENRKDPGETEFGISLRDLIKRHTIELVNCQPIVREMVILHTSKAVGTSENLRAGLQLIEGSWEQSLQFFRNIVQIFIDMKKHSGDGVIDTNGLYGELRNIVVRPKTHQVLCARRNFNFKSSFWMAEPDRILNDVIESRADSLANPILEEVYEMARIVAETIIHKTKEIFEKEEYRFADLKKYCEQYTADMFGKACPENKSWLITHLCYPNTMRATGFLSARWDIMRSFYQSDPTTVDKNAFREEEKQTFDKVFPSGTVRRNLLIAVIIYNGLYAWIYHIPMNELRSFIQDASLARDLRKLIDSLK